MRKNKGQLRWYELMEVNGQFGYKRKGCGARSADAFHANGVPVGPTIEHSTFEGHNDDGIALHGSYALVVRGGCGKSPPARRRVRGLGLFKTLWDALRSE